MKREMTEMLTDVHMSSEEFDEEEGSLVYVVKTVPWESEELKNRKRNMDRIHTKRTIQTLTGAGTKRLKKGALS